MYLFIYLFIYLSIGHFRILGIGLELACDGGSCGGISLERDFEKTPPHQPHLQASFNPIPGIRKWPIYGALKRKPKDELQKSQ